MGVSELSVHTAYALEYQLEYNRIQNPGCFYVIGCAVETGCCKDTFVLQYYAMQTMMPPSQHLRPHGRIVQFWKR